MQYTEVHFKQHEYNVSAQRLMMMMMMMDELTLTWHIVLRLCGNCKKSHQLTSFPAPVQK